MYGCIVGADTDGVWLLAEGYYDSLEAQLSIFKKLDESMDIRLFSIDEETINRIKSDINLIKNEFESKFTNV